MVVIPVDGNRGYRAKSCREDLSKAIEGVLAVFLSIPFSCTPEPFDKIQPKLGADGKVVHRNCLVEKIGPRSRKIEGVDVCG